ncbi:MAG: sugar transferase [Alphaproteobacteria bacterium]
MTIRFDAFEAQGAKLPVVRRRPSFYDKYGKRAFDLALVLLALPAVLPVIALLALMVALSGGKPIYSQPRVGLNGREVRIFKLRTMIPNADRVLAQHLEDNPEARAEWDLKQKLSHDPRITAFGSFLRKSSLDELPQLLNVLKGEMSLVGPRPMLPEQQALYPGKAYGLMRPGITGSWQVSDRNLSSFASRAAFDTQYYEDLTLKEDVALLGKTMVVVMRGTGC